MTAIENPSRFDGLRLALINNRMEAVVNAMTNTLQRTARSAIMNMARDFSCGILTADDDLLTVAESLPCHTFRGPDLQARYMKEWHPDMAKGDAFLANSPYHGNSHAADWCVLMPVIDDAGVHHFTVFAKAHVADCGNSIPTTFYATAKDVYQEGALIFPCSKVQSRYVINQDFVRECKVRLRVPDMWHGDFLAILGAARIGERRLLELVGEMGSDTLRSFSSAWFDYSEQQMAEAISDLPAGSVRVSLMHDPVPGAPDGLPVNADIEVDPAQGRIIVDLTDNLDCQPIGLNLTESTATSNTMAGIFSSPARLVLPNAGSFRRLDIRLRENCMVGIPRHPFSCSTATTNLAETVGKAVAMGLAELGDGFGMAEIGKCLPPAMAVISGVDPREGRGPFVNFLSLLVTNGAGAPKADGWLTVIGVGVAGLQMHDSVEVDEMKYPIEIKAQQIITDSEGAGRFRGAPGAYVEYGPVDTKLEIIYTSDGTHNAPRGVRGGHDGACAQQYKRLRDGSLEELPNFTQLVLEPGETVVSMCTGGGGYGRPDARDPALVLKDVREGWISEQRAKDVYRVAFTQGGALDEGATAQLRAAAQ
ncbi:hydantoinase B/oxoprolinase family protein [Agrobacterium rubi]|nr:hydantoinase B/oxoprolinase family protein [Agrobacterium rubi]NTF28056.1 hydantoinase B/oxoprolinase family protein [Agrobacterium rubi]